MYRLSYERRGDISFIARKTISYFVTSERSEIFTQITYDYSVSRIFLVLLYIFIVICLSILQPSVGRHLCFQRDKKRYHGTKNDITGQKTISRDKKTISRDKKRYHRTYRFYVTVLSP